MTVNVNAKTWIIGTDLTVSGGRVYSDPANILNSGGNAALGWSAASGVVVGNTITISTDGTNPFGAGPTEFTSFSLSESTKSVGSSLVLADTPIDSLSAFVIPKYSADARGDGRSLEIFQKHSSFAEGATDAYRASVGRINVTDATEILVSCAVKIPSGTNFPGRGVDFDGYNGGPNQGDYSSDSSWKILWVEGDSNSSTDDDLVALTHTGAGQLSVSGNDLGNLLDVDANLSVGNAAFRWGAWNRILLHVKAGATPNLDAGSLYFHIANSTHTITQASASATPVVFASGTAPYRWRSVNVFGWMRESPTRNSVNPLITDIYVHAGANAAARVEIGNAANYNDCTDLAMCDLVSWTNTEINAKIRRGGIAFTGPTWLHVTLADNATRYTVQLT